MGGAGDAHEAEADRNALRVMDESAALRPFASLTGRPRRYSGAVAVSPRSASVAKVPNALSASVREVIGHPGRPLSGEVRGYFEPRFGRDFSRVRIHTEAPGTESARAVGAQAYTVGNHIVFARDKYSPNSNHGRGLLAHELTHVVQQGSGSQTSNQLILQRSLGPSSLPSPKQTDPDPAVQITEEEEAVVASAGKALYVRAFENWQAALSNGERENAAYWKSQYESLREESYTEFSKQFGKKVLAFNALALAGAGGGAVGASLGSSLGLGVVGESILGNVGANVSIEGAQHALAKLGNYDRDISGRKFSKDTYKAEIKEGIKWGLAFGILGRLFAARSPVEINESPSTASGVIETKPQSEPKIPDEPKVIVQYDNNRPGDVPKLRAPQLPSNQPLTGTFVYVVTANGELRLSRSEHIDLSNGEPVLAAGEVKLRKGKVVYLDNESGHYTPSGESPRAAAEGAFIKAGLDARGKYVDRKH